MSDDNLDGFSLTRLLLIINNHYDAHQEVPTVGYCMQAMKGHASPRKVADMLLQLHTIFGVDRAKDDRLKEARVLMLVLDDMEALGEDGEEPDREWLDAAIAKAEDDMPN